MKEDVKRAIDTGVNGVVMEIPSSKHMVDLAYRWPMEKAIETSIEATNSLMTTVSRSCSSRSTSRAPN